MAAQPSPPRQRRGHLNTESGEAASCLHALLIAGECRAVGWGVPARLPFVLLQTPYPFAAIVDEDGTLAGQTEFAGIPVIAPTALRDFPAASTVVVLLSPDAYRGAQRLAGLLARIAALGPYRSVTTYLSARDEPLRACGAAARADSERHWRQRLEASLAAARAEPATPVPGRVALWVHRLCKGGAERQIVLLALGLRQLGKAVDLITMHDDLPESRTWAEQLTAAGVNRLPLPKPDTAATQLWPQLRPGTPLHAAAAALAPYFMLAILPILGTYELLRQRRPECLIAYLDDGNIIAGYAAVMAGVPRVHLSGRNAEPNEFPDLHLFTAEKPRLRGLYQALLALPGVTLGNNSGNGALSYARWLGLPPERIAVIANAVDAPRPASGDDPRARHDIPRNVPLILGIMRLDEEKQPLAFVRVIAAVARRLPGVRAILIGDGPLRAAVASEIHTLGLQNKLLLAGLRDGCEPYLGAADLLLLTSRMEGMPNVILEAQLAGKPVVATDVGGVRDALHPNLWAYLCRAGDIGCLATKCLDLLAQPRLARTLGQAAMKFIAEHHDATVLARNTLNAIEPRNGS